MRQELEAGVKEDIAACVTKIGECEAEIAGCVAKIDDVEKELKKEGISAGDLAYLRKEKEQLRKKEELLLTKSLVNGACARTLRRFSSPSQHVVHS